MTTPLVSQVNVPPVQTLPQTGWRPQRKIMLLYQDFGVMGGIERYLLQTARLLMEHEQFQPVVVCTQDGPLYRQMQALGVTVYGLKNRSFFAKSFLRSLDLFGMMEMVRLLKREKPDVVHVHMGLLENTLFKRLGFPVVYTFHGYGTLFSMADVKNPLKLAFKRLTRQWFRQTVQNMDAMLVVSQAEQSRLVEEGYLPDDHRAQVLHNGMPVAEWRARVKAVDRQAVRRSFGVPDGAPCVLFFNRLDFNKNPLHYVALARQLTEKAQPSAEPIPYFLMAGEGPLEGEVREQIADLPSLRYLGLCQDVPALLAVADVVVHPASREGFGLGLVEAMAAEVPVVAYDCGGPREILNLSGLKDWLAPVNDVAALTQKTAQALALPAQAREDLKTQLYQRACDFGVERFMTDLTQVYNHLLPTVSVILPVYNGEETILRAVHSVLNQSYPHLELIVMDDGSSDQTLDKLATVQDERLKVLTQANQGVAVARNSAFRHASGEWIAFIDADDVWLRDKLTTELVVTHRQTRPEQPECLIYSSYYAVNDRDALIHQAPIHRLNGDLSQAVLEHEGIFLPSTALVHRRVFEAVGGFKADCYHEDRVFFIEACRCFPAYGTGERLVLYRQSMGGRCRSVLKDYDRALAAELSIVDTLRGTLSPADLANLTRLQQRNLLYRFLMYNYLHHALHLANVLKADAGSSSFSGKNVPENLFNGKKGSLALLSLNSRINFMAAARLFMQGLSETFFSPVWSWSLKARR